MRQKNGIWRKETDMDLFLMILTTITVSVWYIWPSRIISMTYKTFGWSATIKNADLAEMLIAEKNTWGIATDPGKRNKMSLLGVISYIVFLPQIAFLLYNWYAFFKTGSGKWCKAEQTYFALAMLYYMIGMIIKVREGNRFSRGEIW